MFKFKKGVWISIAVLFLFMGTSIIANFYYLYDMHTYNGPDNSIMVSPTFMHFYYQYGKHIFSRSFVLITLGICGVLFVPLYGLRNHSIPVQTNLMYNVLSPSPFQEIPLPPIEDPKTYKK